ncbi:adenylate kinase [Streptomyces kaniharaensis]|uniref:Adenylate kinase n=1 Tax=Streptomyces kaniharaensis TaxID=212423 RepID=A0A6N7KZI9_9ACTN|nr:adenylate kinase [Streptomyces kaniharaensis]MQS16960.1 adenylate kinase [Streptomyces kaniharaensis]
MKRVIITGSSGAGKTTMAAALAAQLGLPRAELDALHHGPGWVKRPEFEADVDRFTAGPAWVCEEQYYGVLGGLLWERADTLVWLDLPRRTVTRRVVSRSLLRVLTRRELWNGNRETWRDLVDPDHPMRWAWANYAKKRSSTAERLAQHPHLTVVRLVSVRHARDWLLSSANYSG